MTVTAQNNRIAYSGNGVTTSFSFPYYFIASADMKVYVDGVLKTLTTHYTISGSAPYTGGANIVFGSAPANAAEIVLLSDPAITQGVDLVDNDDFPVEASVETPLDRLTLICRRLYDLVTRSFRIGDSVSGSFDGSLTTFAPLGVLRINGDGDGIETVELAATGENGLESPAGLVAGAYDATSNPAVKTKKLTGISPARGASANFPHGIADSSKILGVAVSIYDGSLNKYLPGDTITSLGGPNPSVNYAVFIGLFNVSVSLASNAHADIIGKAVTVWITYEV